MTELKCVDCLKTFSESEVVSCAECDHTVCADCHEEESSDLRDCKCAYICPNCRKQVTNKCKGCLDGGCSLCLSNGCAICSKHKAYEDDLVCDECTTACPLCRQIVCKDHSVIFNTVPDSNNVKQELEYCSECVEKGIDLLILSMKAEAQKFKDAAEKLQEKKDNEDDDSEVQTKKRKLAPDQTLDVDAE